MSSLHVESPKYINFFNKQWSKIPYYVYFIILNFFIQLIFKNKEIKKKKGLRWDSNPQPRVSRLLNTCAKKTAENAFNKQIICIIIQMFYVYYILV